MNREWIERIEDRVNSVSILDDDPFVCESCKNIYRALIVVAENENIPVDNISNILNDANKTIELLQKFDSLNNEKYNGNLSYIFIDMSNYPTLLYLIELLKQSIQNNGTKKFEINNNMLSINDKIQQEQAMNNRAKVTEKKDTKELKEEIEINILNIVLDSVLETCKLLNVRNIEKIEFLPGRIGPTVEVFDGNKKLYMGTSEFGIVEIVRENSIDGEIVFVPYDNIAF